MFRPIICGTKDEPGLIAPLRVGYFPVGVALPYLINNNNQCRIIHYPNAWNRLYEERIAVTDKAAWKGTYLSHHPERQTDHLFYINIYFVFLGLLIYGVIYYAVQEKKVSFLIGSAMKIWKIDSRFRIMILKKVLLSQPFLLISVLGSGCVDKNKDCGKWKHLCNKHNYVKEYCHKTCGRCWTTEEGYSGSTFPKVGRPRKGL